MYGMQLSGNFSREAESPLNIRYLVAGRGDLVPPLS